MKKLPNIIYKIAPCIFIVLILILWQTLSSIGIIPKFMLPSPSDVVIAFWNDRALLMSHAKFTLTEAFIGFLFDYAENHLSMK